MQHRKSTASALDLDLPDDSFPLPTPLTSRNLRPRAEARTGTARRHSELMPPKPFASSSSRRKRPESELEPQSLFVPRKRVRRAGKRELFEEEEEEEQEEQEREEEDQLAEDFVEEILLPSEIAAAAAQAGDGSGPSRYSPISQPAAGSSSSVVRKDSPPVASGSNQRLPSAPPPTVAPRIEPDPLSSYSCPICFFPPTNATLTPCGHICCGSCLFTAVKTMTQRGAMMPDASVARCPVCRAPIAGWDGRGGGVIGLKIRAMFSL